MKELLQSTQLDRVNSSNNSNDLIYRQAAIDALCAVCRMACDKSEFVYDAPQDEQVILCPEHYCLCTLPSAEPEYEEIGYKDCANALLNMWMDEVLTDGEYCRIMDKLNKHWAGRRADEQTG